MAVGILRPRSGPSVSVGPRQHCTLVNLLYTELHYWDDLRAHEVDIIAHGKESVMVMLYSLHYAIDLCSIVYSVKTCPNQWSYCPRWFRTNHRNEASIRINVVWFDTNKLGIKYWLVWPSPLPSPPPFLLLLWWSLETKLILWADCDYSITADFQY